MRISNSKEVVQSLGMTCHTCIGHLKPIYTMFQCILYCVVNLHEEKLSRAGSRLRGITLSIGINIIKTAVAEVVSS